MATKVEVGGPKEFPRTYPRGYQFSALFLKNLQQQRRQTGTNVCQVITPLLVILVLGIVHVTLGSFFNDDTTTSSASSGDGLISVPPVPLNLLTGSSSWSTAEYAYWYVREEGVDAATLGSRPAVCALGGGVLGAVPTTRLNVSGMSLCVPWWTEVASLANASADILAEKQFRDSLSAVERQNFEPTANHSFPLGIVEFHELSDTRLNVTINTEEQATLSSSTARYAFGRAAARSGLISAYLTEMRGVPLRIATWMQAMPYHTLPMSFDLGSTMFGLLAPFALAFLLPVFVFTLVNEKHEKLREMMKMVGLKMTSYWAINFVYDLVVYIVVTLLFIIVGLAFGLRVFTQTAWHIQLLLYLGWGVAEIGFAFLLSVFFQSPRAATVTSYMVSLLFVLVSIILTMVGFPISDGKEMFWVLMLIPPLAAFRGMALIGTNCADMACPMLITAEWRNIFLCLFIEAPILMLLAAYLEEVLPGKEYGVAQHPLFFIPKFMKRKRQRDARKTAELKAAANGADEAEDSDVVEEARSIETGEIPTDSDEFPVVMRKLRKVYHGGSAGRKVAVEGISLHMRRNECFGLLGPNGAGKTTAINMLTGLFGPTNGEAWINGFSILSQMDDVHEVIGVCPQFDIFWQDLTPYETLLFYARMRGIAGKHAEECAKYYLHEIGMTGTGIKSLDGIEKRLVRELSGGMRRRLSVAVALIGNPKVCFFDEPTTGLDVTSRRELWNVLLRAQVGRSMILTTHSMEEADVLCQRIAIVSLGKLKCLGSNVHLKQKFGGGYSLEISGRMGLDSQIDQYISDILPDARLSSSESGHRTYRLPPGQALSEVVLKMSKGTKEHGIVDWGIGTATLEDVFLTIVARDEAIGTEVSPALTPPTASK